MSRHRGPDRARHLSERTTRRLIGGGAVVLTVASFVGIAQAHAPKVTAPQPAAAPPAAVTTVEPTPPPLQPIFPGIAEDVAVVEPTTSAPTVSEPGPDIAAAPSVIATESPRSAEQPSPRPRVTPTPTPNPVQGESAAPTPTPAQVTEPQPTQQPTPTPTPTEQAEPTDAPPSQPDEGDHVHDWDHHRDRDEDEAPLLVEIVTEQADTTEPS